MPYKKEFPYKKMSKKNMAWRVLLHDPDFWDRMSKREFAHLRATCREFREEIPERLAIMRIFRKKVASKACLLRVLPLSVADVVGCRAPVDFVDALRLAEAKTGGFGRCLAMMREQGWAAWCGHGARRAAVREQIERCLRPYAVGVELLAHEAGYRAALASVNNLVIRAWAYVGSLDARIGCILFEQHEYAVVKECVRSAAGAFYRRIHRDVRSAIVRIRGARAARLRQAVHVALSGKWLLIGCIRLE